MGRPTPDNQRAYVADMLDVLRHGDIRVEGLLPYSSNYTLLVWIDYDDRGTYAVYKPQKGERPLWDFPGGTLYQRECAAYLVSEALEFSFVPPTIIRNGPYGVGAFQLFIDHDPDAHLLTMKQEECYTGDILRLAAFDYLINNADRKSGHCLRGDDGCLWAIDHGVCFHQTEKLRTVLWDFTGQRLPPDIAATLRDFDQSLTPNHPLLHRLGTLLDHTEVRAFRQRLETLTTTGVYPAPGSGPHIPWPPV